MTRAVDGEAPALLKCINEVIIGAADFSAALLVIGESIFLPIISPDCADLSFSPVSLLSFKAPRFGKLVLA
jgi:hypothetical protein